MAIDNLPSLLPRESSEDYAAQLLPSLLTLGAIGEGVWARAQPSSNATSPALWPPLHPG
jgi:saccharopine dehydrogenase (NAD+, L-lysine-forming)